MPPKLDPFFVILVLTGWALVTRYSIAIFRRIGSPVRKMSLGGREVHMIDTRECEPRSRRAFPSRGNSASLRLSRQLEKKEKKIKIKRRNKVEKRSSATKFRDAI